jgi:hypothetical protein
MNDLFTELEWRGLIYDSTQGARELLGREAVTALIRPPRASTSAI